MGVVEWEFIFEFKYQGLAAEEVLISPVQKIYSRKGKQRRSKPKPKDQEKALLNDVLPHVLLDILSGNSTMMLSDTSLSAITSNPDLVYQQLLQSSIHGFSAFASSVFHMKHELAITYLGFIQDSLKKRHIILKRNGSINVLHAAASKGNVEFIKMFLKSWKDWGLCSWDVANLLHEKESHGQTPFGMADFQHNVRKRDRAEILALLEQAMRTVTPLEPFEENIQATESSVVFEPRGKRPRVCL
jgi:hypothetical protein